MVLVLVCRDFCSECVWVLLQDLRYCFSPDMLVLAVVFAIGAMAV